MPLRITLQHKTTADVRDFDTDQVRIGRLNRADPPGLDLSFDPCVSRLHAVIPVKQNAAWITDLDSRFGMLVNGRDIRKQGEWRLWPEDTVVIGETTLRITLVPAGAPAPSGPDAEAMSVAPPVQITQMIDTGRSLFSEPAPAGSPTEQRLAVLLDLPAQFAAQANLDALLQFIMDRVVEVIPTARRGALLLQDANHQALLLKAYVSAEEPAVSETLARRALTEKRGFVWQATGSGDTSRSARQHHILHGMYAPIQWQEQVFGVICVDSPQADDAYQEADLRFLIAIGQYAGLALAGQQLRGEAERSARLLDRLMANFSAKVRAVLVDKARHGKLRPGGIKSEVMVLFCDICGFTEMASRMDAHDVVDLLNDYFQPLIKVILHHDGTVDKFIGDAVLAVFGSPDPDPQQHQQAVRAALALQEAVQATSQTRAARGDPTCRMRIGVHCGEVFHGFVGALDRLEFTVIGDAVNRACRYCSAAGEGETLVSPDLFQRVFQLIKAEKTTIQTKEGDLAAYRVSGLKPGP
jgi:adenylate cyclase